SLAAGQELLKLAKTHRVRIWGAPTVVNSPQFLFMARTLADGRLGKVAAAHADYGHTGPDWSSFFYEKGGGSVPDLGAYNLTTLPPTSGTRLMRATTSGNKARRSPRPSWPQESRRCSRRSMPCTFWKSWRRRASPRRRAGACRYGLRSGGR